MTPDSGQSNSVDQAKQLILTTYGASLSDSEKQQINSASSAAQVALLADTFVKDKSEFGTHPSQFGPYVTGSYTGPGVNDDVSKQLSVIVSNEPVVKDNSTAHAAYLISQTDRNTQNGVVFTPQNYVEYASMGSVDKIISTREDKMKQMGSSVVNDDDNKALVTSLQQVNKSAETKPATTTQSSEDIAKEYGQYAAGMSKEIEKQAALSAQKLISDEQSQGKDLNGDGKVGFMSQADFNKRDVSGAFASQQAALRSAVKQDDSKEASDLLNKSITDEKNVKQAIGAIDQQIADNKSAGAWAGVPRNVANAEKADTDAQLKQEKIKTEKFGVAVANMSPQERQNLDAFFKAAKEDPEGTKKFVEAAGAKDAHVALIDQQIADNKSAGAWAGVPRNVANAEKADTDAQLKQEKAAIIAAPIEADTKASLVSSLNPTGSIKKDAELKAFFAKVKEQDDAKHAAVIAQQKADQSDLAWIQAQRRKATGGTSGAPKDDNPLPVPPPPKSSYKMKYS